MISISLLNLKMNITRHRAKVIVFAAWIVTTAVAIFVFYLGVDGYIKARERLVDQTAAYAHLIAEHDDFGFFLSDFILKDVLEDLTWDDFNGPIAPSKRRDAVLKELNNHRERVPSIASFTLIGADGIRRLGITNKNGTDLSHRPYFIYLKDGGQDTYISNFENGLASGKPGIHIARRFNGKNGEFGGVLVINLAAQDFFEPYYTKITLGPNAKTYLRSDTRVLISYPKTTEPINLTTDPVFPAINSNLIKGVVTEVDPADGLKKVFAFESLKSTSIYAVVAVPIAEAVDGAALLLIIAIISDIFLFFGMFAFHAWMRKNIELENAVHKTAVANKEKQLLIHRINTVIEDERKSVAIEIHDVLNATVIAIKLAAGNIAASIKKEPNLASAQTILQLTEQITKSAKDLYTSGRSMVAKLRPEILDVLGLDKALAEMVNSYNKSHPNCVFEFACVGEVFQVTPEKAIAIYRTVQEALSNTIKHANASLVTVSLTYSPSDLAIHIIDDGNGIQSDSIPGFGIFGMRERVEGMHGILSIQANGEQGTDVGIFIPNTQ